MLPATPPFIISPAMTSTPTNTGMGTIASLVIVVLGGIVLTTLPIICFKIKLQYNDTSQNAFLLVVRILLVCSAFMCVGPSLMVLNKEILQTLHFDFPLTLSCLGLLTTAIVIRSLVACGICEVRPETHDAVAGELWSRTVLPIAAAKAGTIACGTAVYLHLGLGFIQMLKALTPVIVVVVMQACAMPLPSRLARWGVYLIITGTLVEVKGELHATLIGLVLMMSSEVLEAINLVLTQKLLQNYKFTLVEGLYMIALPSGTLLFCAAVAIEWPRLVREGGYYVVFEHPWYFAGSCLLGLGVNFVCMAVVQATSGLTMKVLNTVRGIGVILGGVLFYGEYCPPLELCGYGVALCGFSLYNAAQYLESPSEKIPLVSKQGCRPS